MAARGKGRRIAAGEGGQSTLEFALTLMLLMGFVLFYLQLSLVMAFGNYAHYATFMAARAYLAAGATPEDQTRRATEVIVRMLKKSQNQPGVDRFRSIARGGEGGEPAGALIGPGDQFSAADPNSSWMQGVRYNFRSRLFLAPIGPASAGKGPASGELSLQSESWLGREPAYLDCQAEMGKVNGIFDNGC